MSAFLPQLIKSAPTLNDARDRRWIYVPYDRLTDRAGPVHNTNPAQCGIVMVESLEKGTRRPYHKKKLALLLSNERHFALEQAARGVKVIYIFTPGSFGDGLLEAQKKLQGNRAVVGSFLNENGVTNFTFDPISIEEIKATLDRKSVV